MRRAVVLLICLIAAAALYATGVVILVVTPGANEIPTPGFAVIGGMLAMFATLGFFIVGFILAATVET